MACLQAFVHLEGMLKLNASPLSQTQRMKKLLTAILVGIIAGCSWVGAYLYYSVVRYIDPNHGYETFSSPAEKEKMKLYLISREWVEYPVPHVVVDLKKSVCDDTGYRHELRMRANASKYPVILKVEGSVLQCLTQPGRNAGTRR